MTTRENVVALGWRKAAQRLSFDAELRVAFAPAASFVE